MESCIYEFDFGWFANFWHPSAVYTDGAFKNEIFGTCLEQYSIDLRPVPPVRHQKIRLHPNMGQFVQYLGRLTGQMVLYPMQYWQLLRLGYRMICIDLILYQHLRSQKGFLSHYLQIKVQFLSMMIYNLLMLS